MIHFKNIALFFSIWVAVTVTLDDGIALYLNNTAELFSIESDNSTLSHTHSQAHDHYLQKTAQPVLQPLNQNGDSFQTCNDRWVADYFHMAVWQPPKSDLLS